MKSLAKLKKIKGDASFREFYRNRENKSIIVISKKEKLKNLLIYDAINKILIKNKILAPNLLSENYINNDLEPTYCFLKHEYYFLLIENHLDFF